MPNRGSDTWDSVIRIQSLSVPCAIIVKYFKNYSKVDLINKEVKVRQKKMKVLEEPTATATQKAINGFYCHLVTML
jgi:hypothetical protein